LPSLTGAVKKLKLAQAERVIMATDGVADTVHAGQHGVGRGRRKDAAAVTTAYSVQREHHEAALLLDANLTGHEIEECYGYRVRFNKGRTSTSGNADDFDKLSGAGLWQIAGMLPPEESEDDHG